MTFASPQILWLLLVLPPALIVFFWWAWRKRQSLLTQFIQARLLPGLTIGASATRHKVRLAAIVGAVAFLILALARPQWGAQWEEVQQRGLDIVVAIDTSKSMLAEDIAPNRLARAKLAALDLMQQAKSDRMGLVAFAGLAYLQCPLTIDEAAFRQSVDALDVNTISQGGTAIAEAIETAQTAFKEGENYKVVVLLTDGEDQDSGALEAAKKAAQAGVRIYTVGIGTAAGDILRADSVRDEQGNVVKSHLNEELLQRIAGACEGTFYLPLRGAKTIDTLYAELAKLPKSEHKEKLVKRLQERFQWPLAAAILLLLVEMLFPERKREPKAKAAPAGATQLSTPNTKLITAPTTLLLLCLAFAPYGRAASTSSALRDYNAGKYDQSQKEYEQLLERKSDDPRLHFNAGAAAFQNKQLEEAAKQFNDALASPDLKLQGQAYYNRGNAYYHLGERNPDPSKRTETWQKSLQDFESALKLSPQDTDAKFNRDFVKMKLEELKQQQQQQQKQDKSDQKQDQDQKDQQDQQQQQQKQDQSKQDKDQKSQDQKNQSGQKQEDQQSKSGNDQQKQDQQKQQQQQADQKQKEEQQKQQRAADQSQKEAQKQEAKKAAAQQGKEKEGDKDNAEAAAQPGEMTKEEAQQLLDSQKGDEKMLPPNPKGKPSDRPKPLRDW
jgi:Ca-activated chloride channel family protein